MEIVHVVLGKANPERMNGVNKVVNDLAAHQLAAGASVSVWGISGDLTHNYPQRTYTTLIFHKCRFPFSLAARLKAAVASCAPGTVFHLHGGFVPQMFAMAMLLRRYGLPFIVTPHGSYNVVAMKKSRYIKNIYTLLFERRMLRSAATVHVLGQSETAGTRAVCNTVPVVRIPYAFDTRFERPVTILHKKPFIVGYCGRIDIFTKGLDALVAGFRSFLLRHPGSQLWIVGDGKEMPALRHMVAGIEDSVLLCGARYGAEKQVFLSRFSVFAHPSRNEGLPASVLEAAAMGLPCLVSRATNVGEDIERYGCGVTIETTEAGEVCRGLELLYNEISAGNAEKLADNARRMIEETYSREKLSGCYMSMYEKALAQ